MSKVGITLLSCLLLFSCTTAEQEQAFVGKYKLYSDGKPIGDAELQIFPDHTFSSGNVGFINGIGTWSVSSFHTSFGVIIDLHDESGGHLEQLHWDESITDAQVLKDGIQDEEYSKRYIKISDRPA